MAKRDRDIYCYAFTQRDTGADYVGTMTVWSGSLNDVGRIYVEALAQGSTRAEAWRATLDAVHTAHRIHNGKASANALMCDFSADSVEITWRSPKHDDDGGFAPAPGWVLGKVTDGEIGSAFVVTVLRKIVQFAKRAGLSDRFFLSPQHVVEALGPSCVSAARLATADADRWAIQTPAPDLGVKVSPSHAAAMAGNGYKADTEGANDDGE